MYKSTENIRILYSQKICAFKNKSTPNNYTIFTTPKATTGHWPFHTTPTFHECTCTLNKESVPLVTMPALAAWHPTPRVQSETVSTWTRSAPAHGHAQGATPRDVPGVASRRHQTVLWPFDPSSYPSSPSRRLYYSLPYHNDQWLRRRMRSSISNNSSGGAEMKCRSAVE